MSQPKGFPTLVEPQVAILHAEVRTGIVLTLEGTRRTDAQPCFLVMANADEATRYARQKVADDPEIECAIFGSVGDQLIVIRPKWVDDAVESEGT